MLPINNEKDPEKEDKAKFGSQEWIRDFMIPRGFIDVVFILICFILMWYALTYDIAAAKIPIVCANYWNKWAEEKAGVLGSINGSLQTPAGSITNPVTNATPVYIPLNLTSTAVK